MRRTYERVNKTCEFEKIEVNRGKIGINLQDFQYFQSKILLKSLA